MKGIELIDYIKKNQLENAETDEYGCFVITLPDNRPFINCGENYSEWQNFIRQLIYCPNTHNGSYVIYWPEEKDEYGYGMSSIDIHLSEDQLEKIRKHWEGKEK